MKIVYLLLVLISFSTYAQKTDYIDVLVINQHGMNIPRDDIETLIRKKIEIGNKIFKKNHLLINRKLKSLKYIDKNVSFSNLYLEVGTLWSIFNNAEASFKNTTFANLDFSNDIIEWLKEYPNNYKVIVIPKQKMSLECGMSHISENNSFSIISLAETGDCSSDWIFAHELGHQDGLGHEEESSFAGGICDKKETLMHSGINNERWIIFGNPQVCKNIAINRTPYERYKKRSDQNKRLQYRVEKVYAPKNNPIVTSEDYEVDGMDVFGRLVVFNPLSINQNGEVRIIDKKSPNGIKNNKVSLVKKIKVNSGAITTYKFRLNRNQLLGYGAKMDMESNIKW